ncbi:MAG: FliH/SctL family protein [Ilumatobacter sp.]
MRDDEDVRVLARHDAMVARRRQDAGFQSGYVDGQAHAANEVAAAIADHRRNAERLAELHGVFEKAVVQLRADDMSTVDEIESTVVTLAMQIAESIVQREISEHDLVAERIRHAMQLAPRDQRIELRVHPDDEATAIESLDAGLYAHLDDVELIADPSIGRGGCTLDAGDAHIDAQVDVVIERVRADLGLA